MMWQRLLFGAGMIAAILGLVTLDAWMAQPISEIARTDSSPALSSAAIFKTALHHGLPLVLLVLLLSTFACLELGRLCQQGGYAPATGWAAFVSAGLIVAPWIEMLTQKVGLNVPNVLGRPMPLTIFWLTGGWLGGALWILARKTTEKALPNLAITLFMFVYIGLLASFVVRIRCLDSGPMGAYLLFYCLFTIKCGDIGAFFTGKAFGRAKLAPWLSPGKTVEGFLGCLVFSVGFASLALWADDWLGGAAGSDLFPGDVMQVISFGVVMAISGHLGDLLESAIKRDMGSKDSANLVPAFGGLLDIVDSPLMAAPFAWWLLTFWSRIG